MTAQALFQEGRSKVLSRLRLCEMVAIGLGGWLALYSVALINFQRGLAELAGHTQGFCFAVVMVLGGAEASKRRADRRLKRQLCEGLEWTRDFPEALFEKQVALGFHKLGYSLEAICEQEKRAGFCLRGVLHGRTALVHTGFWRAETIDEASLESASDARKHGLYVDQVIVLTRAEVSPETRKRMEANRCEVISGVDFLAFTRHFLTQIPSGRGMGQGLLKK